MLHGSEARDWAGPGCATAELRLQKKVVTDYTSQIFNLRVFCIQPLGGKTTHTESKTPLQVTPL